MLTDDQPEPARQLSARSNLVVCSNADMGTAAVRDAEVITILADASAIVDLLAQIAPSLRAGQLVVSMAAAVFVSTPGSASSAASGPSLEHYEGLGGGNGAAGAQ